MKLSEAALLLTRLNDMWSFTGKPLTWKVGVYLQGNPESDVDNLLQVVRAYAALAQAAGDVMCVVEIPSEWDRLFKEAGQAIMFDLPRRLTYREQRKFDKLLSKAFLCGWKTCPPLPPLPPGADPKTGI